MSNVNKNITVEAKLITPPTYKHIGMASIKTKIVNIFVFAFLSLVMSSSLQFRVVLSCDTATCPFALLH